MDNNKTNGQPVGLFADKALKDDPSSNLMNPEAIASTQDNVNTTPIDYSADESENLTARSGKKTTIASGAALKLAVVGHTNTGKTSILRTLLRDVYFGEVKNEAATTRHVEQAKLTDSQTGEDLVILYDTPGLEDASGLMDWLEDNTASRRDGIERLQQFLAADIA